LLERFGVVRLTINATPDIVYSCLSDYKKESIDKELILRTINEYRKTGCQCDKNTFMKPVAKLKWSTELEEAAWLHTTFMYENKIMDHDDFCNKGRYKPNNRLRYLGYYKWNAGENIAWGYTDENGVMDGWKHSPGHCKIMLGEYYTHVAVARMGNYWAMVVGYVYAPEEEERKSHLYYEKYYQEQKEKEKQELYKRGAIRQQRLKYVQEFPTKLLDTINILRSSVKLQMNSKLIIPSNLKTFQSYIKITDKEVDKYSISAAINADTISDNLLMHIHRILLDSSMRSILLNEQLTEINFQMGNVSESQNTEIKILLARPKQLLLREINFLRDSNFLIENTKLTKVAYKMAMQEINKAKSKARLLTPEEFMKRSGVPHKKFDCFVVNTPDVTTDREFAYYITSQFSKRFINPKFKEAGICRVDNCWVLIMVEQ